MIKLENKPFNEYVTLDNETLKVYISALNLGKFPPVDRFGVVDIFSAPWGFVKDLQEETCVKGLSYAPMLDIYVDYGFATAKEAYAMGVFHIREVMQWSVEQIKIINQVEQAKLSGGRLSSAEYAAGIEKLDAFRSFPQTDALAKGDPLKYDDVRRKLKYYDAFLKLSLDAAVREYRKELSNILKPRKT